MITCKWEYLWSSSFSDSKSKQGSGCGGSGGGGGSFLLLEYYTTVRAAGQGGLTGMPEGVGVHGSIGEGLAKDYRKWEISLKF